MKNCINQILHKPGSLKQSTKISLQTVICLPCKNVQVNVMSKELFIQDNSTAVALINVIRGLSAIWNRIRNLHYSVRDKIATGISKHSVQNNSKAVFMNKYC